MELARLKRELCFCLCSVRAVGGPTTARTALLVCDTLYLIKILLFRIHYMYSHLFCEAAAGVRRDAESESTALAIGTEYDGAGCAGAARRVG